MISRIHSKLGTAGFIVAIVALIAALGGGAYAASQPGLNSKQKKQVKSIAQKEAKKFATAGPQGPPGTPGAAGAAGKDGTNGSDGAPGEDGVSVTTANASVGECPNGGFKWTSANGSGKVCNGAPGTPGTPGADGEDGACSNAEPNCEMPAGSTLTGHWGFAMQGEGLAAAPISFNLAYPNPAGPALHFVSAEAIEEEEVPAECTTAGGEEGSVTNPVADSGHLCVYEAPPQGGGYGFESGLSDPEEPNTGFGPDAYGETLFFSGEAFAFGTGTWAVTAP